MSQMQIHLIVAQRVELYAGQEAPEVLGAISAFDHEESPAYLDKKLKEAKADPDIESAVVITVAIDAAKVMQLLRPKNVDLAGIIVGA